MLIVCFYLNQKSSCIIVIYDRDDANICVMVNCHYNSYLLFNSAALDAFDELIPGVFSRTNLAIISQGFGNGPRILQQTWGSAVTNNQRELEPSWEEYRHGSNS